MFRVARHWDPLRELDQLRNEMTKLFSGGQRASVPACSEFPAVNVWRSQHGLALTAEVPGVETDHLDITVTSDTVTVAGNFPEQKLPQGQTYHRQERLNEPFTRTIELPFEVDPQQTEATYEKGVLLLKLNRPDEHKPKKVVIKPA